VQGIDILAKLHVGSGNDILPGWINHDLAPLPGVDVVHDLEAFPWPFEDNGFEEIRMINVLEHLSNAIKSIEELHRISNSGAKVCIRVPYWNSRDMATDPTHKTFFSEYSFDYFDPSKRHCQERPYYSKARFRIVRKHFYTNITIFNLVGYLKISFPPLQAIMSAFARHLCGVIWVVEFELIALK
jgi:SAM-dependent methyltransferase